MDFSEDQEVALNRIEEWKQARKKPYLTCGGYAGVGKSTIVSYLAQNWSTTAVVALCGKAANVLRQKGVADAKTIHSLVYIPFEDKQGKVRYRKRDRLEGIRSIIVDEASMLDHLLWQDLLSFGLPILLVGDHGQLEPIGTKPNLMKNPEVRLERIHRQAAGNPILRLATAFREGRDVPYWSDKQGRLNIVHRSEFKRLVRPGVQIICGYNKTRHMVNARVREMSGVNIKKTPLPIPGDVLMCVSNRKAFGVYNGQLFKCVQSSCTSKRYIDLQVISEEGVTTFIPCLAEQFGKDLIADFKDQRVAQMDYGSCITGHKSQGSEWSDVLINEEIAGAWNPQRWRYTVVTRAKEHLTYCG